MSDERDKYEHDRDRVRIRYERLSSQYPINSEKANSATHDEVRKVWKAYRSWVNFPDFNTWSNRRHRRMMTKTRGSR